MPAVEEASVQAMKAEHDEPEELTPVGASAPIADVAVERSLVGVGISGTSGQSTLRRLRFAFGSYGPVATMFVVYFAKDMYILKLGADARRVGAIATVWSFAFPLAYPVAGHLMDREPSLLERPGWGRRAPWFFSHLVPTAIITFMIFLPGLAIVPKPGSLILDVWLAICLTFSAWCLLVLLNVIESSRAEIYPFKEERVVIEGMTKFIGVIASGTGIVPQFILWVDASLPVRFGVSCFLSICVLLSLEVVPILKDAKQPRIEDKQATFQESLAVLMSPPMTHATCIRFWHSAADTVSLNFSIYYLTFVDGFDSAERAKWMLIGGIFVAVMESAILTPFWSFVWGRNVASRPRSPCTLSQSMARSMQGMCCAFHVMGALLPPLCLRALPGIGLPRPWEWVVYNIAVRFFFSPQSFFRINSFCWAVDGDCHRGQGRRREAVHAGIVKLFEDEGRALAFAVFLGLTWAGLQTENCELVCEGLEGRDSCVKACDQRDILRQPRAVTDYIEAVLTYVVPVFGLLCALHIWLFPLHGELLEELQQTQAKAFKQVKPKNAQLNDVQPTVLGTMTCSPTGLQ
eukprot:CAMPEP_0117528678 /NCGR_PEP_ID=MMETSP0784-20121206/37438_1 /TAXON_ID=39447 /ORGANISM="" /LENGTH=574 /DNA_ID=CAMNT_0005324971 /DNA_START=158 /DNA_END=1882 /DNA_ORIENTATION=-